MIFFSKIVSALFHNLQYLPKIKFATAHYCQRACWIIVNSLPSSTVVNDFSSFLRCSTIVNRHVGLLSTAQQIGIDQISLQDGPLQGLEYILMRLGQVRFSSQVVKRLKIPAGQPPAGVRTHPYVIRLGQVLKLGSKKIENPCRTAPRRGQNTSLHDQVRLGSQVR